MSVSVSTAKDGSVTTDSGTTTSMVEKNGETSNAIVPNACSKLRLCCIGAFFIVLTALAIYVMITFPQTDF